jgi:transposase-like protein
MAIQCPDYGGTHLRKNGHREHKQNYICVGCGRQFLDHYEERGYIRAGILGWVVGNLSCRNLSTLVGVGRLVELLFLDH